MLKITEIAGVRAKTDKKVLLQHFICKRLREKIGTALVKLNNHFRHVNSRHFLIMMALETGISRICGKDKDGMCVLTLTIKNKSQRAWFFLIFLFQSEFFFSSSYFKNNKC